MKTTIDAAPICKVPLVVKERIGANREKVVVSNGIPLPLGRVYCESDLRIENSKGEIITAGFSPLQRWQDGSWRFAMTNFITDLPANEQADFELILGKGEEPVPAIKVEENEKTFTVITGPLKFMVKKEAFNGIDQAWLDETASGEFSDKNQIIASHEGGVLACIDGIPYTSVKGEVLSAEIERQDAVQVVLKITGRLSSGTDSKLNYKVWIKAWAGSQEVEVTFHIVKIEGEWWDDYHSVDEISFNIPLKTDGDVCYDFGGKYEPHQGRVNKSAAIYQAGSDLYHFMRANKVAASVKSGKSDQSPDTGWMDIRSGGKGIGAVYKWFWQNFPSELSVDESGLLSIQVWSKHHQPFKFYTGVSKTTEMRFYFHRCDEPVQQVQNRLKAFQKVTIAQPPTSWYCQETRAVDPRLLDLDLANYPEGEHPFIELYIKNFEEGYRKLLRDRLDNPHYAKGEDGYGFMNFGDGLTPAGGYTRFDTTNNSSVEGTWWANNYYDHPHCFILQFFRTGKLEYLDYALEHVYHLMDIDTASSDPEFHVPGDYKTGPGVMHIRDYTAEYVNEKGERAWRLGGQPGHWHFQSVESLFEAHYLMGIDQAAATGLEAADFAVKVATLNFTSETRTMGHTLEGLAAAYRHTWNEKYLVRMNQVWDRIREHARTDFTGVNPDFPYKPEYKPYVYVQNTPFQNGIVLSGGYKYRAFSPCVMGDEGVDIILRNTLNWDMWGREVTPGGRNTGWNKKKGKWSTEAAVMTTAGAWLDRVFPDKGFLPILRQGLISILLSNFHMHHLKAFSHTFKYSWLTQFELAKDEFRNKLYNSFTAFPRNIKAGETVVFNNQSMGAVYCNWEFGDGDTSDSCDINVSHTYSAPGRYSVKLTITAVDGTSETLLIPDYINVK